MMKMEKPVRKSLGSALVAALLLGVVLMCRSRTAWADAGDSGVSAGAGFFS